MRALTLQERANVTVDAADSDYKYQLTNTLNQSGYGVLEISKAAKNSRMSERDYFFAFVNQFEPPFPPINLTHKDEQPLHTHNHSRGLVLIYCEQPAEIGGNSTIMHGKSLYDHLQWNDPPVLRALLRDKGDGFFTNQYGTILRLGAHPDMPDRYLRDVSDRHKRSLENAVDKNAVYFGLSKGDVLVAVDSVVAHGKTEVMKGNRSVWVREVHEKGILSSLIKFTFEPNSYQFKFMI